MDEMTHRLSELFNVPGNGLRLQIVIELEENSWNVNELVETLAKPTEAVSRHLRFYVIMTWFRQRRRAHTESPHL